MYIFKNKITKNAYNKKNSRSQKIIVHFMSVSEKDSVNQNKKYFF